MVTADQAFVVHLWKRLWAQRLTITGILAILWIIFDRFMKWTTLTTFNLNLSLSRKFLQSLVIVGELAPSDIQPSIQVESTITDYQLSNGTIYSKYYRGQLTFPDSYSHSHATAEIEFNSTVKSWGYSYVAHRSKKDLKHQFIMSILSINCGNEITYNCLGSYGSPEFQIQCQRRARGHVKLKW